MYWLITSSYLYIIHIDRVTYSMDEIYKKKYIPIGIRFVVHTDKRQAPQCSQFITLLRQLLIQLRNECLLPSPTNPPVSPSVQSSQTQPPKDQDKGLSVQIYRDTSPLSDGGSCSHARRTEPYYISMRRKLRR